ncbi:MAG: hypothetical protein HQL41_00115 [Alphaproteobacteria bacterium]|nr:hypothetical protein [Alphaproteobacteria bacterium]
MVAPAPAKRALEEYNRLIALPWSETEEIGKMLWRLKIDRRKMPADLQTAVAYLHCLICAGEASEARMEATDLIHWWRQMDSQLAMSFWQNLLCVGLYEDAILLANDLQDAEDVATGRIKAAVGLGDAKLLRSFFPGPGHVHDTAEYLLGRHDHFLAHQRAIREVVADVQLDIDFAESVGDAVGSIFMIYVKGDRAYRRKLEEVIDEATAKVAAEFGQPQDALPLVTLVMSHTAHGPTGVPHRGGRS